MKLSLKNPLTEIWNEEPAKRLNLVESRFELSDDRHREVDLNEWPIMVFLRGEGFTDVEFHTTDHEVIEAWALRMNLYQQRFIEDPEYWALEEHSWNEFQVETNELLIECLRRGEARPTKGKLEAPSNPVPPMLAPLGIDEASIKAIFREVEEETPLSTLQRIQSILTEFRREARAETVSIWARLLADIASTSLRAGFLETAKQIMDDHPEDLGPVWTDKQRVLNLLSSYDPKATELKEWAKLFRTCPLSILIEVLDHSLASPAGPQLIKLMNLRAQNETELMIEQCFVASPQNQKLILQWLSPYWKPRQFLKVLGKVNEILNSKNQSELLSSWIAALIRTSSAEAYEELLQRFEKPSFVQKLTKAKTQLSTQVQKAILHGTEEVLSIESAEFFRKIKPHVSGEVADNVERLLHANKTRGDSQ